MDQKCVLVTGGSRGIGAAVALQAAAKGHPVAVNYGSDEAAADRLVREIVDAGGNARAFRADIGSERAIEELFASVESAFGPPGALVNSAGIASHVRAADATGDAIRRLLDVNVTGTMLTCREAVRRMSTKQGGRGGAIVNVSSMAAFAGGRPGASHYAASKAAVDLFSVALAKEVALEGIRVNVVRPGVTETDMVGALRTDERQREAVEATIPMGRIARPEEVARAVLWLLSEEASFVTGARLDVSGGGFVVGAATR